MNTTFFTVVYAKIVIIQEMHEYKRGKMSGNTYCP